MKRNEMKKSLITLLCIVLSAAPFIQTEAQNMRFEGSIEDGGGVGLDDLSNYSAATSLIGGCRFSNHFFLGIGAGFRYTDALYYGSYDYDSYDGKYLIPVFARLKVDILKTRVSPFVAMDVGTTFNVSQNDTKNIKGLTYEPQIGLDVRFRNPALRIYFTFYLNVQKCEYDYYGYSYDIGIDHIKSNALTLGSKVGFSF